MGDSSHNCEYHSFVDKVLKRDYEMSMGMTEKNMQIKEIYALFRQRLELFDKALLLPVNEIDKTLLTSKRAELCIDLKMFKLKQDLLRDLNELANRIERIESQIIGKQVRFYNSNSLVD